MYSQNKIARITGLLYLVIIVTGIFYLKIIPSKLIDWHNPATTFNNITASETLFRFGILGELFGYVLFMFLPLVLYKLLSPVNKTYALLMVILGLISLPISFFNMLDKFAVLTLVSHADYLHVFNPAQLQAEVMLHLHNYNNGNMIASIFWGLWLFPFGYLVFKSGFLPKAIGILLMIGCFGYVINFACDLMLPQYGKSGLSAFVTAPASLGELAICLWMLIVGVRQRQIG